MKMVTTYCLHSQPSFVKEDSDQDRTREDLKNGRIWRGTGGNDTCSDTVKWGLCKASPCQLGQHTLHSSCRPRAALTQTVLDAALILGTSVLLELTKGLSVQTLTQCMGVGPKMGR